MKLYADWHTHSKYSDGRGTIEESVNAAIFRGLDEVAITDHGPANMGVGVDGEEMYQTIHKEIDELNQKYDNIVIKTGAEADIVSVDGTIDLSRDTIKDLDLLIVGLHPFVFTPKPQGLWEIVGVNALSKYNTTAMKKAETNNTKALKEAVSKYPVDFVSHPGLGMPVDLEELFAFCGRHDTAVEINTGHQYDKSELIEYAMKTGVDLVVNSDAHFPQTVGALGEGLALLEKYNVPTEKVLNARL